MNNNEEIYYLTSKDVAKILHMKPRYARELLKRENVPVIKIGRQYLIPAKDFHKYLQEKIKDSAK